MKPLLAKPVVEELQRETSTRVAKFVAQAGRKPKLSVVLVGEDPASVIYTRRKGEAAVAVGMDHESIHLPATSKPEEVRQVIERLNRDHKVDGILIQRPLPKSFREEEVLFWVTPEKDVDAFHPSNTGSLVLGLPCFAPCTPSGVMEILRHYGIPVAGKVACVVGRSSIVGKPMSSLLLQADATVIQAHSKTKDLKAAVSSADIVVAAVGKPKMIPGDWIRPGAVVIDVGINRLADGKIVGDVDYESASKVASAITPVPGGVGPMTIAVLLRNTVLSAEKRGS